MQNRFESNSVLFFILTSIGCLSRGFAQGCVSAAACSCRRDRLQSCTHMHAQYWADRQLRNHAIANFQNLRADSTVLQRYRFLLTCLTDLTK